MFENWRTKINNKIFFSSEFDKNLKQSIDQHLNVKKIWIIFLLLVHSTEFQLIYMQYSKAFYRTTDRLIGVLHFSVCIFVDFHRLSACVHTVRTMNTYFVCDGGVATSKDKQTHHLQLYIWYIQVFVYLNDLPTTVIYLMKWNNMTTETWAGHKKKKKINTCNCEQFAQNSRIFLKVIIQYSTFI